MIGKGGLLLVIGFSIILGVIGLNVNRFAIQATGHMGTYNEATASHALAVSGANVALAKFYQDTTWTGPITQTMAGLPFSGSFTANVIDLNPDCLMLRSVSSYSSEGAGVLHDTVDVYFNRRRYSSFTLFAWMTNFEGNSFWVTGDTVWGKAHSNGNIHVNGRPVFLGKVTTAKGFDPKPNVGVDKAVFKNGYETGVAAIDFPTDLSEIINAASSGGRRYAGDIWVTLLPGSSANNDGSVVVRQTKAGPVIDSVVLGQPGFNGALLGEGRVNVQGTLDGALSIASLSDIYIQNDIYYERDPRAGASDDVLGLVAEQNVVIADNADNNSDCIVDGSIFTRSGSLTAENYGSRGLSGTLQVFGSIVQYIRGDVAAYAGSALKSGFAKSYIFDDRLADPSVRPPYYPGYYVKTLSIANWWESYRISDLE